MKQFIQIIFMQIGAVNENENKNNFLTNGNGKQE